MDFVVLSHEEHRPKDVQVVSNVAASGIRRRSLLVGASPVCCVYAVHYFNTLHIFWEVTHQLLCESNFTVTY